MPNEKLTYKAQDEPVPGYTLVSVIGKGGAGTTWKAINRGGIEVAIKIVDQLDARAGRRDLQGMQRVKNIRHPNLCTIHGLWTKDAAGRILEDADTAAAAQDSKSATDSSRLGDTMHAPVESTPSRAVQLIIAMELGEETLGDVLERNPNGLAAPQAFRYLESAGRAIHKLNHEHSICHCDIKPQNILLVGGEAKVCDYGLAQEVVDSRETASPAFTPRYGAPEMQLYGKYHPRMDQYSLALTYAELRTGRFPFEVTTAGGLARQKWAGEFDLSGLTPAERGVISRAMDPDAEKRFATIEEMLEALRTALFAPADSHRAPPGRQSGRWLKSLAALGVIGALLLLAAYAADRGLQLGWTARLIELVQNRTGDQRPPKDNPAGTDVGPATKTDQPSGDQKEHPGPDPKPPGGAEPKPGPGPSKIPLQQLLDGFFELADAALKDEELETARTNLARIRDTLANASGEAASSSRARLALYEARVAAQEKAWPKVRSGVEQARGELAALPQADQTRLYLLDAKARLELAPESLVKNEGLKSLTELRARLAELTDWEVQWQEEVEAQALQRLPADLDALSDAEQHLVRGLWRNPAFQRKLERLLMLGRPGPNQNLPEALKLLNALEAWAEQEGEKNQVTFARGFLDFRTAVAEGRLNDGPAMLQTLLDRMAKLPKNVTGLNPQALFADLADRFEADIQEQKLDGVSAAGVCDRWFKLAPPRDPTLDRRLRTVATVAWLCRGPLPAANLKELAPLLGTPGASQTLVAAWVEAKLEQEDFTELEASPHVKKFAGDKPGGLDPDYAAYVQALLLARRDGPPQAAAELLVKLADKPGTRLMQVTSRRVAAARILARAAGELAETDADDLSKDVYSEAGSRTALPFLEKAAAFLRGQDLPAADASIVREVDESRVLAQFAVRGDQQEVLQQLQTQAQALLASGSDSGQLRRVRALTAGQLARRAQDEPTRNQALQAYGSLADWIAKTPDWSRYSTCCEKLLEDSESLLKELPGLRELRNLKAAELLPHLPEPRDPVRSRLQAIPERESVALLYALRARLLMRSYEDRAERIRARLLELAIAAWLTPQVPDFLVEVGETLKSVTELDWDQRLAAMEALGNQARTLSPDSPAANGLLGYVNGRLSRRELDLKRRAEKLDIASGQFREALKGNAPEALRARYLIGLSTTLLERAFVEEGETAEEVRRKRSALLKEARDRASEATKIERPADGPELAWIAKGNAEEDLAFYVRDFKEFRASNQSFSLAVQQAGTAGRSTAPALMNRARCRLRDLEHQGIAAAATALRSEVLKDLIEAEKNPGSDSLAAEVQFWKGRVLTDLAQAETPKQAEHLAAADQAYEKAVTLAQTAGLPEWSTYQVSWVFSAKLANSAAFAERCQELFTAARDPKRQGLLGERDVFDAICAYYEVVARAQAALPVESFRRELTAWLAWFAQRGPRGETHRIRLLCYLSRRSHLLYPTLSEELLDAAGADATAALKLATALAERSRTEGAELLGLAHAALGFYHDRKYVRAASLAQAQQVVDELQLALDSFRLHHERSDTDEAQRLRDTDACRLKLGERSLDLARQYRDLAEPLAAGDERTATIAKGTAAAKAGQGALQVLRNKLGVPALNAIVEKLLGDLADVTTELGKL